MSRSLHTNRDFEKLEPYEGKPSRTVLRGEEGSNALDLPDTPVPEDGEPRQRPQTTLTDFFLVSPGVRVLSVRTLPLGFRSSDHNPVVMRVVFENTAGAGSQ